MSILLYLKEIDAKELISATQIQKLKSKLSLPAYKRILNWHELMLNNKDIDEKEKLKKVNNFFNRLHFKHDIKQFIGNNDYWQTPIEFLINGAGDCEDYAIAKYFTLVALGIKYNKLRITYVKLLKENEAHMVLTYYKKPGAVPVVLDNRFKKIELATKLPNLKPVYSFNGNGLWMAKLRGEDRRLGKSKRLNKWRDLVYRMVKEE